MFIDFIEDMWPFLLLIGLGILVIIFVGYGIQQKYNRLMAQCMADGKKEYECVSMLKNDVDIVPMPIVIPVGR